MQVADNSLIFLSPGKSDFLNLLRWVAALIVVMGHADMYLGQFGGDPSHWNSFAYLGQHAHAAVMVFFVLSGYVVAYASDKKSNTGEYDFRSYFLDRWSRIYSVLLAAIAFTLLIDFVGRQLSPFYSDPAFLPQTQLTLRLLVNIFALQGIQGYRIQLGSNPALWSIGYEFIFYMLFGLMYFRRTLFRRTWPPFILVTAMLLMVGWKMSVYFGIWLMGVLAYRLYNAGGWGRRRISPWLFLAIVLLANHMIVFNGVWLNEIMRDILFGAIVAVMLSFEIKRPMKLRSWQVAVNIYLADFSYSLYAFHMPLLFFICSMWFENFQHWPKILPGLVLTLSCLVIARLFFWLSESRRRAFRTVGARVLTGMRI